jgi:CBS domain-containing protein/tetratricopeptide (TPR) repeat protein
MGTVDFSERGGHAVNIEDLIKDLAEPGPPDEQAIRDFTEACRQVDEDPRERQRYRDIADLIEAEDALYAQAVAALGRGDHDTALPLLRMAAERSVGDAAWLLAATLDKRGEADEAATWYERAARDGDSRAEAALGARQTPGIVTARTDILTLDFLASDLAGPAADAASPAVAMLWPVRQPPRGSFIARTCTHRPEASDFTLLSGTAGWRPLAIDVAIDAVVFLADPGQHSPWSGAGFSLRPLSCLTQRLGRLNRLTDADLEPAAPCRLQIISACSAAGDNDAYRVVHLGTWPSRRHWAAADLAGLPSRYDEAAYLAAREALALLGNSARYAGAHRAVVPWPGRRSPGGTVAGQVMIPYAVLPVLAPDTTVDAALEEMLRSGEPALPVGEDPAVAGVVTLAGLARSVRDSRGVPSIQRIEALMQPAVEMPMDAPLAAVRAAMYRGDGGLVVVRGPGGGVAGYITASSLLADAVPDEDDGNRERPRMEVPLLGAGRGTARICVPV